jgi:Raf kinase inhibitor-like YbhB/YbcL family protein
MIGRALIAALVLVVGAASAASAAGFTVSSPAFAENAALPANGAQPDCGGGTSVSPPLAWSDAPAGVTSYAVVLYDPDAPGGPGFVHWVAYGIPASTTSLPADYGASTAGHVAGANGRGAPVFAGYCPPPGSGAHHFMFTVYATDLAPDALATGLTRDALLTALHGHVKAAMSLVGRFGR